MGQRDSTSLAGLCLSAELAQRSHAVVRGVIAPDVLQVWQGHADQALIEAARPGSALQADFVPTATSLRLAATGLLPDVHEALAPLWPQLRAALGGEVVVSQREAWIRRQYPPNRGPAGASPHTWHQDGALRFDFTQTTIPDDALLPLVTAWLPLVACGETAPGLELVAKPQAALCPLADLREEAVRAHWTPGDFVAPALAAGDVLLLAGGTLHRTYATPEMVHTRTSFELRYFRDPPPERVGGDFLLC